MLCRTSHDGITRTLVSVDNRQTVSNGNVALHPRKEAIMNDIAVDNATIRDSGVQVLLIHGGFHGSWVWDKVVDRLAALGWPAQTFELPSVAAKGRRRYGMCDDALA